MAVPFASLMRCQNRRDIFGLFCEHKSVVRIGDEGQSENRGSDRDRTLFEFEKRISHNCASLVAKKRRFSWVNRDNDRNSKAIESMVESEP